MEPERFGALERDVERLMHDLYGNGQQGLLSEATAFFAEYRENRQNNIEFQNQRDKENAIRESRRWKALGAILTVFGLILGALTYLEANRQIRDHSLKIPSTYQLKREQPVVVSMQKPPQDASRF
jgi:hypothetical protein